MQIFIAKIFWNTLYKKLLNKIVFQIKKEPIKNSYSQKTYQYQVFLLANKLSEKQLQKLQQSWLRRHID